MEGQTATNPQTGEKVVLRGGQWVPAGGASPQPAPQSRSPGFIPGIPKQPDPYDVQQDAEADARANTNTGLSVESGTRSQKGQVQDFRKEFTATMPVKTYGIAIQSLSNAIKRGEDGSGDVALIYDYAKAMDPESVVRESEVAMAQGGQSAIESAATRFKKEFGLEGGGVLTPETRQRLRREIINAARSRMQAYDQQRDFFADIAERNNFNADDIIGPHLGEPFREELSNFGVSGRKFTPEEMAARAARGEAESETEQPQRPTGNFAATVNTDKLGPGEKYAYDESGVPIGILDANGEWISGYGQIIDNASERAALQRLEDNGDMDYAKGGEAGLNRGVMLGLSDEIGGVAAGLGSLVRGGEFGKGYREARDTERAAQDISRREAGMVPELLGGLLIPGGALGTAKNVGQFVKQGATIGAVGGYGEGRGAVNSLMGAGVGGAAGAALGGTISQAPRAANALMQSAPGQKIAGALRRTPGEVNREVIEAGRRQNIPIRQPDARPETRNAFAVVEASPSQGPKIKTTLDADKAAVRSRLDEVSGDGTRLDNFSMGERIQGAGQRAIVKTRAQANAMYGRATQLAGDTKVKPDQALKAIDDNIAELTQAGPKGNAGAIKYLKDLRSDLARGELSIDQLRSIRTNMRGQISERNLTATDAERRVGDVLRAASADIERGLTGNPQALGAYKSADKFYQEKQTFIKDVVQKFTGSRNNPLSAEQAATKFKAMMQNKGDYKRFSEMMKRLDPEERSDIAASIGESMGTSARNGEFTLAALATNVEKLNPRALRDLFGEEGAKAIADLRIIARAKADTAGGLNNSKSGVVSAGTNQFKDILLGAVGGSTAGIPGAMAGMAARGGIERLTSARAARLLLNPDFTKWLRQTPNSTSPAVINRHFDRLNKIASREQVFLMDAKALQDYLRGSVSEGVGRAAATGDQGQDNGRK